MGRCVLKKVMEKCFKLQQEFWKDQFNSYPKAPYMEEFDELFIENSTDEEGYAEWKPIEQNTKIEENIIEKTLGIKLNSELKEFYSSYCFMQLIGKMGNGTIVNIDGIPSKKINEYILEKYIDSSQVDKYGIFTGKYDLFELGSATIDGNDGFLVCFDNIKGSVLFIYFVEKKIYDIGMSLNGLLNSFMEVY